MSGRELSAGQKPLLRFLLRCAGTALTGFLLLHFVFGVFVCRGSAMDPSLRDGDLVITFRPGRPAVNDVAAVRWGDHTEFARVAAAEGDLVSITGEEYTVNGMIPAEDLGPTPPDPESVSMPCRVAAGQVFLLHDCRQDTADSRRYGCAEEKDLAGKVIFIFRRRGF